MRRSTKQNCTELDIYTGGLAFYVGMAEKKVDIGYWDAVYFMIFVGAIMRCKSSGF